TADPVSSDLDLRRYRERMAWSYYRCIVNVLNEPLRMVMRRPVPALPGRLFPFLPFVFGEPASQEPTPHRMSAVHAPGGPRERLERRENERYRASPTDAYPADRTLACRSYTCCAGPGNEQCP